MKINMLTDKMIDVTLQGTMKKCTHLIPYTKNKDGKYFAFYLFESAESQIRLTAFNKSTETLFSSIKNNEYEACPKSNFPYLQKKCRMQRRVTRNSKECSVD